MVLKSVEQIQTLVEAVIIMCFLHLHDKILNFQMPDKEGENNALET